MINLRNTSLLAVMTVVMMAVAFGSCSDAPDSPANNPAEASGKGMLYLLNSGDHNSKYLPTIASLDLGNGKYTSNAYKTVSGHDLNCMNVSFTCDGDRLYVIPHSGDRSYYIEVIDCKTMQRIARLRNSTYVNLGFKPIPRDGMVYFWKYIIKENVFDDEMYWQCMVGYDNSTFELVDTMRIKPEIENYGLSVINCLAASDDYMYYCEDNVTGGDCKSRIIKRSWTDRNYYREIGLQNKDYVLLYVCDDEIIYAQSRHYEPEYLSATGFCLTRITFDGTENKINRLFGSISQYKDDLYCINNEWEPKLYKISMATGETTEFDLENCISPFFIKVNPFTGELFLLDSVSDVPYQSTLLRRYSADGRYITSYKVGDYIMDITFGR